MVSMRDSEIGNSKTIETVKYQKDFDAPELSSGIYIVKLESDNYAQSIKMILSK